MLTAACVFPLEIWELICQESDFSDLFSLALVSHSLTKICSRVYSKQFQRLETVGYTQKDVDRFLKDGIWRINRSTTISLREDIRLRSMIIEGIAKEIAVNLYGNGHRLISTSTGDDTIISLRNLTICIKEITIVCADNSTAKVTTLGNNIRWTALQQQAPRYISGATGSTGPMVEPRNRNRRRDIPDEKQKEMQKKQKQAQRLENKYRQRR